jgi:hypothetical protein
MKEGLPYFRVIWRLAFLAFRPFIILINRWIWLMWLRLFLMNWLPWVQQGNTISLPEMICTGIKLLFDVCCGCTTATGWHSGSRRLLPPHCCFRVVSLFRASDLHELSPWFKKCCQLAGTHTRSEPYCPISPWLQSASDRASAACRRS